MNILSGFFEQDMERARLERLEKILKSAKILGLKKCIKCGFCCHKRTCIPTPNELKKIAEFLVLKPQKLIENYFAIDRQWMQITYYLKPLGKNIKDLGGKLIPAERTFNEGKCIFLDKNNLCEIYSVKPKQAKLMKCWEEQKDTYDPTKFWENNELLTEFGIDSGKAEKEIEDCDDEDDEDY